MSANYFGQTVNSNLGKVKSFFLTLAIAGATVFGASCCEKPEPIPTREVELKFDQDNGGDVLTFETLQKYANDNTIKTIYLIPTDGWGNFMDANITFMRNNFLQPRLNISSKIKGRGDFNFKLGEASKVPQDSLWYVQNGWTINKQHQK